MKINHRIVLRDDDPLLRDVVPLGLALDSQYGLTVLNVTEDNPAWPAVQRILERHGSPVHSINNIYSPKEMDAAEWLVVGARGHHGYPQPADDFGYVEQTYDVADYCPTCGMGGVQKAPFRFLSEPKASHSQFIQLNWVFDELFVRGQAREGLEEADITGIEFTSPVLHKKGLPCKEVAQMRVLSVLPPGLDPSNLNRVTCKPENECAWRTGGTLMRFGVSRDTGRLCPCPDTLAEWAFPLRECHAARMPGRSWEQRKKRWKFS